MPLRRFSFLVVGNGPRAAYAGDLLARLGADVVRVGRGPVPALESKVRPWTGDTAADVLARMPVAAALDQDGLVPRQAPFPVVAMAPDRDPAAAWAASGVMALTGEANAEPLVAPGFQAGYLHGASAVLAALAALSRDGVAAAPIDGAALPGERAAIAHVHRQGRISVGGASRLVPTADGWLAVSLARPNDFDTLPAWLGSAVDTLDPWAAVERGVAGMGAQEAADFGQLLGLPVAAVPDDAAGAGPWNVAGDTAADHRRPPTYAAVPRRGPPLVIDLSALWAGPLATSLLRPLGARVIKVESRNRPDGARRGPPAFFDLLNGGKESVLLDLEGPEGLSTLRRLVDAADVVVEAGRGRVMRNWGIDVEDVVGRRRNLTWVTVTGYGRTGPHGNRVAFGDDAAAAAGLVARAADFTPRFCGDAYADPVTGLHAAVAIAAGVLGGGSHLIDISLSGVCRHLLTGAEVSRVHARPTVAVEEPRARPALGTGPALGEHTDQVLSEIRAS